MFRSQRVGQIQSGLSIRPPGYKALYWGPNKGRVSYDSLSIYQLVSGLLSKSQNRRYPDFGWNSAKASHVVLLCCLEEGKVSWQDTTKTDPKESVKLPSKTK